MRFNRTASLIAATVAVATIGAGSAASLHASSRSQQTVTKRLTFVERELASPTADLGKHGFSPLDRQTITSDILDLHGHLVGRIDDDCGITAVGKRAGAVCSAVMTFNDGQIVGTRFYSFTSHTESPQPITGGSGAYLGAHGQVKTLTKTKRGLEFEIDLTQ
jgi:hypothetical protein